MKSNVAWVSLGVLLAGCGASETGSGGAGASSETTTAVGGSGDGCGIACTTSSVTGVATGANTSASTGCVGAGCNPAAGFVAEPGFEVSGTLGHGEEIVIRKAGGGFGTREHPVPWLWDVTSAQWLAGTNVDAYAGVADGGPINASLWTSIEGHDPYLGPDHIFHVTTDPGRLRHARLEAEYGLFAKNDSDPQPYAKLSYPVWPDAWGPHDNEELYVSWWYRVTGPNPGTPIAADGSGGEDKLFRLGNNAWVIGCAGGGGETVGHGNMRAWGSTTDPGAEWQRVELYFDRTRGIVDLWQDGALGIGAYSGVGGPFEFRPADQYLWVDPPVSGTQLASSGWENLTVGWLGFDDGGSNTMFAPGRNVEVSEVYVDVTRARVEIADVSEWKDQPGVARPSEVQGRLLDWADDEIKVVLNQGAFDSLAGLTLWVIRPDGAPVKVGHFE